MPAATNIGALSCPTGPNWYVSLPITCVKVPCVTSGIHTHRFRALKCANFTQISMGCGLARPQYGADHRNIAHAFAPVCLLNVETIICIPHLIRFRPAGQFRQNTGFGQGRVNRHWSAPRLVFRTYCIRNRKLTALVCSGSCRVCIGGIPTPRGSKLSAECF